MTDPDRLLNRELSWLDFNARVLALAADPTVPLLERSKFLAIFAQNLDEYFQVRVAGLLDQVAAGITSETADGRTPGEQLSGIHVRATDLTKRHEHIFLDQVVPELADCGIRFSSWDELDLDDRKHLVETFDERIYPVLTPLAVDPGHPFPYISDLSLNLAVDLRDPKTGMHRFARVKVPSLLSRFVVLPDGERFVPLEQVIAAHLDRLFGGMEVLEASSFRVTRNADLTLEEEEAEDLLAAVEIELRRRRFGKAVRLEVDAEMSDPILALLKRELDVADEDVYRFVGPLDLSGLWGIAGLDRPDLKDPSWTGLNAASLVHDADEPVDMFEEISEKDILLHHPYISFSATVDEFIRQASVDPMVQAIKMTLYRTSGDSPIVQALIRASERGKQVAVLVELKARFDEAANIEWARALEESGVHVVYGLVGLKTHTKTALVVRQEQVVAPPHRRANQRVARADLLDGVARDGIVHEPRAQVEQFEHRHAAAVVDITAANQKPQGESSEIPAVVFFALLVGLDRLSELEELEIPLGRHEGPEHRGPELDRFVVPGPSHLVEEREAVFKRRLELARVSRMHMPAPRSVLPLSALELQCRRVGL